MIFKVENNSTIIKERIDAITGNNNSGNVFQSAEMNSFWNSQIGCKAYAFFVLSSDLTEVLASSLCVVVSDGNMLKRRLSRRAIIYGEPIITESGNRDQIHSFLIQNVMKFLRNKSIYIEIRNFNVLHEFHENFDQYGWKYIDYQNYRIDLTSEEEVFKRFKGEKRRQIRKSLREGAIVNYDKDKTKIKEVYQILFKIYHEKIGKPLPSYEFFEDLMKMKNSGIICVLLENQVIGGGFFVFDKNTIFDWYRGGLDFEFKKHYPSTVAAWGVMDYGIKNEIPNFDFMGAGIKGQEYGVRSFKSQFGGELIDNGRYIHINNELYYRLGKIGINLLGKLR